MSNGGWSRTLLIVVAALCVFLLGLPTNAVAAEADDTDAAASKPPTQPATPQPATAQPPPPAAALPLLGPVPAANQPPPEIRLGSAQIAAGSVLMFATLLVSGALLSNNRPTVPFYVVFFGAPGLTGFVVCSMGRHSDDYEGGCVPSMVGGYLGALTTVPLAMLGCQLLHDEADNGCMAGVFLGGAIGYVVLTAIGATIGWHVFKTPKKSVCAQLIAGPALSERALAFSDDSRLARERTSQGSTYRNHFGVTLLALDF